MGISTCNNRDSFFSFFVSTQTTGNLETRDPQRNRRMNERSIVRAAYKTTTTTADALDG
jgi:hypothetical protein